MVFGREGLLKSALGAAVGSKRTVGSSGSYPWLQSDTTFTSHNYVGFSVFYLKKGFVAAEKKSSLNTTAVPSLPFY